jgi:type IV pilus assembly protein PilW
LSLVELMVGIVVALLVGLAAAQSAVMFTASQRQGIGAGGSSVSAATTLAAVKSDLALAGLGFFGEDRFLCHELNLSRGAGVLRDGDDFSPLRVTAGGGADTIDVFHATRVEGGANVLLSAASDGTEARLDSFMPAQVGDTVLLAPQDPGDECTVRSVTAVTPSTATTPQVLAFDAAGEHNGGAFANVPTYVERAQVALIGELRWNRYRVDGTDLVLERPLDDAEAVILRNVVAFRAQYGTTAVGGTSLEAWQDAVGADFASLDADAIDRVRALRVGVVVRSPQREKPNAAGECEATPALPQLFGVAVTPDVTDWRCFRFRTSVVIVPLRNFVR